MKHPGSYGAIRPLVPGMLAALLLAASPAHGVGTMARPSPADTARSAPHPATTAASQAGTTTVVKSRQTARSGDPRELPADGTARRNPAKGRVATQKGVLRVTGYDPPVYLLETRPVETKLGNPEIMDATKAWLSEIGRATQHLDLEEFYLSDMPGEPLRGVLEEIGRAAARGVRVRLLLDARMGGTYPQPADSLGKVPNIEVRKIDFGRLAGGVQHAKYFLVDGRTTVLGSQNTDWRSLKHIHEMGVCVRDTAVTRVFQDVFDVDWRMAADTLHARELMRAAARNYPEVFRVKGQGEVVEIRPSYSPRGWLPDSTKWDRDAIVRSIDAAKREVVIQVLTYSPRGYHTEDATLDGALRRAAARGVRVKLLTSDWNTTRNGIAALKDLLGVPNLEVRLGTVPEWSQAYIPFARVEHCKYMVVDTLVTWVGTSNWDPSYFHGTRNVAVTLTSRRLALQARRSFEASWASDIAKPVLPDVEYQPKPHGAEGPPGRKVYGK